MKHVTRTKGSIASLALVLALTPVLALSGCGLLGPGLAPELIGEWSASSTYYTQTFTFTSSTISYEDYATNTGGSSSWDRKIVEANNAEQWFLDDYDYYWIWHISGSTLYLKKLDSGVSPDDVPSDWWSDSGYGKYYLTKD